MLLLGVNKWIIGSEPSDIITSQPMNKLHSLNGNTRHIKPVSMETSSNTFDIILPAEKVLHTNALDDSIIQL